MKLYTKTGDKGITSLYDGSRIPKSSVIFDVLGNLDELSSHIGVLCAKIGQPNLSLTGPGPKQQETSLSILREIQVKLLDIGSNIAVIDEKKKKRVPIIEEKDVRRVEVWIDTCEIVNGKLTEFLLTGIKEKDSQCHVCRSVSRRVERSMWKLMNDDKIKIDDEILKYMNRLSDFFFSFARNFANGEEIKLSDIKKKLASK
jgi:cob(I)alamin adenosyltransferase